VRSRTHRASGPAHRKDEKVERMPGELLEDGATSRLLSHDAVGLREELQRTVHELQNGDMKGGDLWGERLREPATQLVVILDLLRVLDLVLLPNRGVAANGAQNVGDRGDVLREDEVEVHPGRSFAQ